ncbi:hypothetical protein LTR10_007871 [Elasticomyces elasticus]|nr:hypothetical protein LTR10_007871 [Elasticomyces elasticus]KAK4970871.1 hypothetical protein LTR42_007848 [Elasticomyces elasticus]
MNSSLFASAQHTEAESRAISSYLQMGFLNHTHQYHALWYLVWRHLKARANANKVDIRKLNESQLDEVANHFMETYEQRLWPRDLDKASLLRHLNHPGGDHGKGHHDRTTSVIRYVREGRYHMDSDERRQDTIDTGEEPVQYELRRMSELVGLVAKYIEFVKDAEEPDTGLTQKELLRCVLAGVDYVGNGQTMAGVPDLSEEERVLQAL